MAAVTAERLTARVVGRVQGVGFRWWTVRLAQRLELVGRVSNGDDERSVEVVAEGPAPALDEFEQALRRGPSSARVETVEARRSPASGEFSDYGIVLS